MRNARTRVVGESARLGLRTSTVRSLCTFGFCRSMNYPVHFLLAGDDDELRLGNLLGDFVKGQLTAGRQVETLHNRLRPVVIGKRRP
jgi:hypothetical protein